MKKLLMLVLVIFVGQASAQTLLSFVDFENGISRSAKGTMTVVPTNARLTTGKFGKTMYFDGNNTQLKFLNQFETSFENSGITINFWVYPLGATGESTIIKKMSAFNDGILVTLAENGEGFTLNVNIRDQYGRNYVCNECTSALPEKSWTHLSIFISKERLKIAKNSNIEVEHSYPEIINFDNSSDILFGDIDSENSFLGYVDDIKIIKGELTQDALSKTYDEAFETRLGDVRDSFDGIELFVADEIYKAPTDGFLTVSFSGGSCGSNHAIVRIGSSSQNVDNYYSRINGYVGTTVPLSKRDYFKIDHYKKYSDCRAVIFFRSIY